MTTITYSQGDASNYLLVHRDEYERLLKAEQDLASLAPGTNNSLRVLVTISRTWEDWQLVDEILSSLPRFAVLVHGDCPKGDRQLAAKWFARNGQLEPHPAEWDEYGDRAGPIRNHHMVSLGADLCLAFIRDNSPGASHCATTADRARIPTLRFRR